MTYLRTISLLILGYIDWKAMLSLVMSPEAQYFSYNESLRGKRRYLCAHLHMIVLLRTVGSYNALVL